MRWTVAWALRSVPRWYSAVKETISEIKDCEWRPLVYRDGSESDTEQVCQHVACDDKNRSVYADCAKKAH